MINLTILADDYLHIRTAEQRLYEVRQGVIVRDYPVSTGLNGLGEMRDSGCTPRGWFAIRAKFGEGCPLNTVFVGRRATGEIYSLELKSLFPARDWILTRILWLGGLEAGKNRFGVCDTLSRFIYLHGCPDEIFLDRPLSHGCIRLQNADIVILYAQASVGMRVFIE